MGGCEQPTVDWSDPISVNSTQLFCTLSNIYPYTMYVVRVRAITAAGKGKISEINAQTMSLGKQDISGRITDYISIFINVVTLDINTVING